jgi:hypothetical protein
MRSFVERFNSLLERVKSEDRDLTVSAWCCCHIRSPWVSKVVVNVFLQSLLDDDDGDGDDDDGDDDDNDDDDDDDDDAQVAVVGGGAGGVELALALRYRINQLLQDPSRLSDRKVYIKCGPAGVLQPFRIALQSMLTNCLLLRSLGVNKAFQSGK